MRYLPVVISSSEVTSWYWTSSPSVVLFLSPTVSDPAKPMLAINNSSMVKDNRSFVIIIYKVFGYLQGLYMVDIAMFSLFIAWLAYDFTKFGNIYDLCNYFWGIGQRIFLGKNRIRFVSLLKYRHKYRNYSWYLQIIQEIFLGFATEASLFKV